VDRYLLDNEVNGPGNPPEQTAEHHEQQSLTDQVLIEYDPDNETCSTLSSPAVDVAFIAAGTWQWAPQSIMRVNFTQSRQGVHPHHHCLEDHEQKRVRKHPNMAPRKETAILYTNNAK
jgi:hypothetical protein